MESMERVFSQASMKLSKTRGETHMKQIAWNRRNLSEHPGTKTFETQTRRSQYDWLHYRHPALFRDLDGFSAYTVLT